MTQAPVEQRHRDAADDEYWSRKALAEAYANLEANHHKIKAMGDDLAEIDRIAVAGQWGQNDMGSLFEVAAIAAPYRASDPVAEAAREAIEAIWQHGTPSRDAVIAAVINLARTIEGDR